MANKLHNDIPFTGDELWALLDYNPDTGELRWKPRGVDTRLGRTWDTRYAGTIAGVGVRQARSGKPHQVRVMLNGISYGAHRIIWKMVTGCEPPARIDHEDGNPWNNCWYNLRDGSAGVNLKNCCLRSDNKSGYPGVSWSSRLWKWWVYVKVAGKQKTVGWFDEDDLDLAIMESMEARADLGYSKRHGKPA